MAGLVWDTNPNGSIVHISQEAFADILMSGLEAYAIPHAHEKSPSTSIETYASLWGHTNRLPNGKTVYSVEKVSVDTSAKREYESVVPVHDTLFLKQDIMTSFFPQYSYLGDFHTHPYTEATDFIRRHKLYCFSDDDLRFIEDYPAWWYQRGHRVGLVMTITVLERAGRREPIRLNDATIEFTLRNYRLWLKACIYNYAFDRLIRDMEKGGARPRSAKYQDTNLLLDCPALMGLEHMHCNFGRVRVDEKKKLKHVAGEC